MGAGAALARLRMVRNIMIADICITEICAGAGREVTLLVSCTDKIELTRIVK